MSVVDNLKAINEIIENTCEKVGRTSDEINIIAVTKYVTAETAKEAVEAGINHLGENRAEGLLSKVNEEGLESAQWHFIGTLQSRKVKDIINQVRMIHSLDRISVANQIEKRANHPIECFVQVNVSEESSKHGLKIEEVESFITALKDYKNVRIVGLMTMAPHIEDKAELRSVFKKLRTLRDYIQTLEFSHAPCHYLSMGMSNDFDVAIEEGATHIRIGTKLVGSELKGA